MQANAQNSDYLRRGESLRIDSSVDNDTLYDVPEKPVSPITFSGYAEVYYSFDAANPDDHNRPSFLYSHSRHNEITLNLGYLKAAYNNNGVRANLALMAGTYANVNLAAEPGVLKNIYEANVGVKISRRKDLWIDAGILSSHMGFESATGAANWNLTRSLLAESSPYYQSGARITYKSNNGKWLLLGVVMNGWQRIQRVPGNNTPAGGHQLKYTPNKRITINSSSFIGSDFPDSARRMRYFHNFYTILQLTPKLGVTAGFDIGAEQKSKGSSNYNTWYAPILMLRYTPTEHTAVAVRGEYYSDKSGVIIATGTPNGFRTLGFSANFDYRVNSKLLWRMEGRGFNSRNPIFVLDKKAATGNYAATTSLCFSF